MKPGDIAIEVVGFVVRMWLAVFVFCQIDLVNGRPYEQAMGAGMIFLLMNSERGGKA